MLRVACSVLFSMLEMNPKFNFSKTCSGDLKKSKLQERKRKGLLDQWGVCHVIKK